MNRQVQQILEYHTSAPLANIAGPMTMDDLNIDSLDCIEIVMDIEDRIGIIITDAEIDGINTVQDIFDLVNRKQEEKSVNQAPALTPIEEKPKDEQYNSSL